MFSLFCTCGELLLKIYIGTSLADQWLGLCTSNARGVSSIPGRGTRIPRAVKCDQINKQTNKIYINIYIIKSSQSLPLAHNSFTLLSTATCDWLVKTTLKFLLERGEGWRGECLGIFFCDPVWSLSLLKIAFSFLHLSLSATSQDRDLLQ